MRFDLILKFALKLSNHHFFSDWFLKWRKTINTRKRNLYEAVPGRCNRWPDSPIPTFTRILNDMLLSWKFFLTPCYCEWWMIAKFTMVFTLTEIVPAHVDFAYHCLKYTIIHYSFYSVTSSAQQWLALGWKGLRFLMGIWHFDYN